MECPCVNKSVSMLRGSENLWSKMLSNEAVSLFACRYNAGNELYLQAQTMVCFPKPVPQILRPNQVNLKVKT